MRRVLPRYAAWAMMGLMAGPIAGVTAGPASGQDIIKDAKASLSDLPGWKIPEICAKDSAQAHCLALESRAWRTVSGSWVSVPEAVKKLCLGNVKGAGDQSWRVLGDCVDEEMEKRGDKVAVATRFTAAEPVPPPKPARIDVPPPPVGGILPPPPFALDAEAEAKRKADAEAAAKKAAEEAEAKRLADEAAAKKAAEESDAKRKADAEAKRLADEAAARKAAEDAEAKRKADAEAKRVADEAAAKKAAEDAERKRIADAEAKRIADEAAAKKAAEDAERKRIADAEAAKRAALEAAAKVCQDKLKSVADGGAILFRISSARLDQTSNATLDQLASVVKSCPGNAVRVEGHTDSNGEPDSNMELSRNRAQAVVDHLVRAGVAVELIRAEGFGETRPKGDNATSEGRAQNRRIEFKVMPR